jgi:hypothetical protein
MNELLSWTLPIGAALACVALAFNALQVISSKDEFWIARLWFIVAAIILLARFIVWGLTTNRSLTLRLIVGFSACGVIVVSAIGGVRYVNRKSALWIKSHQVQAESPPPPEVTTPPSSEAKPEISCLRGHVFSAFMNDNGEISNDPNTRYEDDEATLYNVAVAEFYREADQSSDRWIDVRAHLLFYDEEGDLRHRINDAVWLDEESNHATFYFGDSKALIVAVGGEEDGIAYGGLYNRGQSDIDFSPRFSLYHELLSKKLYLVKIELIGQNERGVRLNKTFDFDLSIKPELAFSARPPLL